MARTDKLMGLIKRLMAPISQRVRLMVSRGVVELVNDSLKCQGLQVSLLADELRDDVERFQEYGFTSTPFTGSEAIFLSVGGNRSHGIVACVTDRRYRPTDLNEGDVCLFTDKGERVYLERVGDILNLGAKSAAEFVSLATKTGTELSSLKTTIDNLVTAYNAHVHTGTGCLGAAHASPGTPHGAVGSVAATKVKAT